MPASPARRAIHRVRRSLLGARRILARAGAIERARQSLVATDAEPPLVRPRDVAQHLGAGVLGPAASRAGLGIEAERVVVGPFASIAHGVQFHASEPDFSRRVAQFPLRARLGSSEGEDDERGAGGAGAAGAAGGDIEVGPDAWIAQGAIVMSGVTIGPGAVVATRAVVTQDVAPYAIVAGVPATKIGQRFDDGQIAALLRIAWWDWPLSTIKSRVDELSNPDVDAFIAAFDPGLGE